MNKLLKLAPLASVCLAQSDTTTKLVSGQDKLWQFGSGLPLECDQFDSGSVSAFFCPDMRFLFFTDSLLTETIESADNLMESDTRLQGITVHSFSKEAEHEGDLIILKDYSEVWRVTDQHSAEEGEDHSYQLVMLFKLRLQEDVRAVEVFDNFALVIFEDESVRLALRPEVEGDYASYNEQLVDVFAAERSSLYLHETPIQYFSIVPDSSQTYDYLLNLLTRQLDGGTEYLSQHGIRMDRENKVALFEEKIVPSVATDSELFISSIDSNDQITVVGLPANNEGLGEVYILDSQSLELRQVIQGAAETKPQVGKTVKIQQDPLSNGNRIWYSSGNRIVMASYVSYGQNLIFDDEIFVQEVASLETNVELIEDSLVFGSVAEDATLSLFEFTACLSGTEYSESADSDNIRSRSCVPCGEDLYSSGFSGCQECSFWQRFTQESSYLKNIIDNGCLYTEEETNDVTKAIIEALQDNSETEKSISIIVNKVDDSIDVIVNELYETEQERLEAKNTAWIIIPIVLSVSMVIAAIASTVCCMQGCCCECFYLKCKMCTKYQRSKKAVAIKEAEKNYQSIEKQKHQAQEVGRPSILNFDMCEDVTGDATQVDVTKGGGATDLEAEESPNKQKVQQAPTRTGGHSRNTSMGSKSDLKSSRHPVVLTQSDDASQSKKSHFDKVDTGRKASMTQARETSEIKSEQFQGSAFRNPSEQVENPALGQGGQNHKNRMAQTRAGDNGVQEENDSNWMFEETEQEDFE